MKKLMRLSEVTPPFLCQHNNKTSRLGELEKSLISKNNKKDCFKKNQLLYWQ
jgi:hypothetical protein